MAPLCIDTNLCALRLRLGKLETAEQAFSAALLCDSEVCIDIYVD